MNKSKYKVLGLAALSIAILSGCNGGTTNNYYTNNEAAGCQLPAFTPELGNYLLTKWGKSVQEYSPANYGSGDVYIGAGYFTMSNYTSDAILLPTVSAQQRYGTEQIYDYFTHFLMLNPVMSIPDPESNVFDQLDCGYGSGHGYYDFVVTDPTTSVKSTVHARFTFIYKYESQPFVERVIVESGALAGQVNTQTNAPGWYVWAQHSSGLPSSQ